MQINDPVRGAFASLDAHDGELRVLNNAKPRPVVTPAIGGTLTGPLQIDGVGTASIVPNYLLVTVLTAPDDVLGATRLKAGYPEAFLVVPGQEFPPILSDVAITDVYMIAVDATAAAPANYTGNYGIISLADADLADWLANQIHLSFDASDVVKEVNVTLTDVYGTNYATAQVTGVSHA